MLDPWSLSCFFVCFNLCLKLVDWFFYFFDVLMVNLIIRHHVSLSFNMFAFTNVLYFNLLQN
uniref:Uncharacterized protein n=1 Tax=Rhizophora mucronata TaxID=61149 RepID=A0A2P2MS54_RHIMU